MAMLAPVHVDNLELLFGSNQLQRKRSDIYKQVYKQALNKSSKRSPAGLERQHPRWPGNQL